MTFYLKCMQDEVTETVSEVSEKSLGERLVYISAFDLIFDVLYKLKLRWHVFVIICTSLVVHTSHFSSVFQL